MDVQDGFIVGVFNYCDGWCQACPFTSRCRVFADIAEMEAAHDPSAVIGWFHILISVKVARALRGLADDDPAERTWRADHEGSAKVALLGTERSHEAWLQLAADQVVSWADAQDFVRELVWIRDEIDRIFPNARAFVRPGFDEPDKVAKLLAVEGA